MIETLKFDFQVEHPYTYLIKYARQIQGIEQANIQKMVQIAWTFVNDCMSTNLCLQWEADIIAISSLYLASKVVKVEIDNWEVFLKRFGAIYFLNAFFTRAGLKQMIKNSGKISWRIWTLKHLSAFVTAYWIFILILQVYSMKDKLFLRALNIVGLLNVCNKFFIKSALLFSQLLKPGFG